jgi:phage terminase small subunit
MARKLSALQKQYVHHRARGLPREQSALLAGYSDQGINLTKLEKSVSVQEELARIKALTVENTGVTKEKVVEMLKEAADMAKLQADPMGMVSAARELGKMLGFYAPEVKKITRDINKDDLQKLLSEMPEDELLRLANARVIDGTARRVDEEKV